MNHISNRGDTDKSEGDIKAKVDRPASPASPKTPRMQLMNISIDQNSIRMDPSRNQVRIRQKIKAVPRDIWYSTAQTSFW